MEGVCELCERSVRVRTRHHLIPRTRHSNKRNKKLFDREDVRQRVVWLCKPCHRQIHISLTPKELELEFNTVRRLRTHPEVSRFVDWIRDRPDGTTVTSLPRRRRGSRGR